MRMKIKKLEGSDVELIIVILFLCDADLQKERQLNFEVKVFNK